VGDNAGTIGFRAAGKFDQLAETKELAPGYKNPSVTVTIGEPAEEQGASPSI
jgi:hypothetical protein